MVSFFPLLISKSCLKGSSPSCHCFHPGIGCLDNLPRLSLCSACLCSNLSGNSKPHSNGRISFTGVLAFFLCGGFWGAALVPSAALSLQGDMDPCAVSLSSPDSCLLKYPSAGELQHPASEFMGFLSAKGGEPRSSPSTRGIAFNGEKAYIKLNSVRKA